MRPKLSRLVVGALVVGLGLLGYGCIGTPKNPTDFKQLEQKVRAGVPIGSTRSEVEAWLKSQGIESHYRDKPKPLILGQKPSYGTVYYQSRLDPETISGTVSGVIPDTGRAFMVRFDTQIFFFLDENSKLLKSQVKTLGTGL